MNKLKNKKGMTLMEMMVSLVILVMLVVAMGTGMDSAMQIYGDATFESNSAALADIVNTSLGDLLRYAENIRTPAAGSDFYTTDGIRLQNVGFVFTNKEYGVRDCYFYTGDDQASNSGEADSAYIGDLQLKNLHNTSAINLVNSGAYPDLGISNFKITYVVPGYKAVDGAPAARGGYFEVTYDILSLADDSKVRNVTTIVRLLNAE